MSALNEQVNLGTEKSGMSGGQIFLLIIVIIVVVIGGYSGYRYYAMSKKLSDWGAEHGNISKAEEEKLLKAGASKWGLRHMMVRKNNTKVCSPNCAVHGDCQTDSAGQNRCVCEFPYTGATCSAMIENHEDIEDKRKLTSKEITMNRYACNVLKEPTACSFLRFHGEKTK
jgi:hypothetical protein